MTIRREITQSRCVAPIALQEQWVPGLEPQGRRTGDPLLCRMQRVNSTLTD